MLWARSWPEYIEIVPVTPCLQRAKRIQGLVVKATKTEWFWLLSRQLGLLRRDLVLDQDCRTEAEQERFASYRLNVFKGLGGGKVCKGRVVLNVPFVCLKWGAL